MPSIVRGEERNDRSDVVRGRRAAERYDPTGCNDSFGMLVETSMDQFVAPGLTALHRMP